jgi:catalase
MFAYPDAARYRLGVNYQQLPCNRPVVPVYCPYQRDGFATVNGNYGGDPNYVRSALKPVQFIPSKGQYFSKENDKHHHTWVMGSVADYTSAVTDDDFVQASLFWEKVLSRQEGQQERLAVNVAAHLVGANEVVWEDVFGKSRASIPSCWCCDGSSANVVHTAMFSRVAPELGEAIRTATFAHAHKKKAGLQI